MKGGPSGRDWDVAADAHDHGKRRCKSSRMCHLVDLDRLTIVLGLVYDLVSDSRKERRKERRRGNQRVGRRGEALASGLALYVGHSCAD